MRLGSVFFVLAVTTGSLALADPVDDDAVGSDPERVEESERPSDSESESGEGDETPSGVPFELRADYGAYELDTLNRVLDPSVRRLRCDTSGMTTYRGSSLPFRMPVSMHRAFVPYVQRFEELASEVAKEVYGRAPRFLSHRGSYNCRRIRGVRTTLSEHALGNALDLKGFDFYSAAADEPLPEGAPESLRRSFKIRVEEHWSARYGDRAYHAVFFARLRERLEAEPSLFGVMLGPSYPGHHDHLHLDRAPIRFVRF